MSETHQFIPRNTVKVTEVETQQHNGPISRLYQTLFCQNSTNRFSKFKFLHWHTSAYFAVSD